ncbi:MAG: hypothetical protein KatS3mg076_1275 [Candidatus Binatia bacterium]|nr:MAG: hypothetical protein KatS3mg076_1275 [Candidatus Binatia bacterium]
MTTNAPHPAYEIDPWAPRERAKTLRFAALAVLVHAGLLLLFATVTLEIARRVERIGVKVESPFGDEDFEGIPSLRDLAGALRVGRAKASRAAPAAPRIENVRATALPPLGAIGPTLGRGPKTNDSLPLAYGSGIVAGLGAGGFGDYVGGLRKVGLDVALVVDTTESMQFAIDEVKAKLSTFVEVLQRMVPTTRVGIVIYRDEGDEYVVRWTDLSFHTAKLTEFLRHVRASGGGDWEEAVFEALEVAIRELSWRKRSKKIVVLVAGSPPHPWEEEDVLELVREFRSQGGYVSTIDVTKRLHYEHDIFLWRSLHGREPYRPSPMPEHYRKTAEVLEEIAREGGGERVALEDEKRLVREVVVLTFGERWKVELDRFLEELS